MIQAVRLCPINPIQEWRSNAGHDGDCLMVHCDSADFR